jgi:hypothetical protein
MISRSSVRQQITKPPKKPKLSSRARFKNLTTNLKKVKGKK